MNNSTVAPIKGINVIIALLLLTTVGITAFWLSFFYGGAVHSSQEYWYLVFERTFPVPDGVIAFNAALCALGLWRRKQWALLWGLMAVGGLLFLGLIDIAFNVQNDIYQIASGAVRTEIIINIFCIGFGALLASFLWHNRNRLEA